MVVAVKKLKPEGFQGHKEWLVGFFYNNFLYVCVYKISCLAYLLIANKFQTEVNYLGQLYHPNLVKLIGYCLEGENRLLVYEFMPKGSLENHLFRSK